MSELGALTTNVERLLDEIGALETPIHAGRSHVRSALAAAQRADRDPEARHAARIRTEHLVRADRALADALRAAAASQQAGRAWLAVHRAAPGPGGGAGASGPAASDGGRALDDAQLRFLGTSAVVGAVLDAAGAPLRAGQPGDVGRHPTHADYAVAGAALATGVVGGTWAAGLAAPLIALAMPMHGGAIVSAGAEFLVGKLLEHGVDLAGKHALGTNDPWGSLLDQLRHRGTAWTPAQQQAWAAAGGANLVASGLQTLTGHQILLVSLAVAFAGWGYRIHADQHTGRSR